MNFASSFATSNTDSRIHTQTCLFARNQPHQPFPNRQLTKIRVIFLFLYLVSCLLIRIILEASDGMLFSAYDKQMPWSSSSPLIVRDPSKLGTTVLAQLLRVLDRRSAPSVSAFDRWNKCSCDSKTAMWPWTCWTICCFSY